MLRHTCAVLAAALAVLPGCRSDERPVYRDPSRSIEERTEDLLGRMTRREKFRQLFLVVDDGTVDHGRYREGLFGLQLRWSPDSATDAGSIAHRLNAVQHFFVDSTRLGIPIIAVEEALHGVVQEEATAFPQAIALAASWDTALMSRVADAIAREARGRGIRQVLSPVLNLATDVRWGRTEETYGEDPFLASRMGVAFVRAFEGAGVVATPKHFVANAGDGGRDSYPILLSHQALEILHFPPFRAAIQEAGARSIMASYNSVDGLPASASPWLLDTTLRRSWGFNGVVISDANGTGGAVTQHFTAQDYPASGANALRAGLDVIFQTSIAHDSLFWPAFAGGVIPDSVIDEAVRRVLRVKFALGLFEHPYVEVPDTVPADDANEKLALEAAREAITLLRNRDGRLPLSRKLSRVVVIGPDAVTPRLGGYSGPGRAPVSILEAIRAKLPRAQVRFAAGPGRDSSTTWRREVGEAERLARRSEVAIVVAGIEEGEFRDRASLRLPGAQEALIRAIAESGRPVIVVLVGGSAVVMGDWIHQTDGVLMAWYPGEQGGRAVADVLFGDANPAGRLPITFPRAEGQLPLTYYHLPSGRGDDYVDLPGTPAFPFGFGLSYTTFDYRDLSLSPTSTGPRDSLEVQFTIQNTGPVAGDEVPQLYLHDEAASIAQPVLRLAGFQRIHLAPGEARRVRFVLGPDQLALLNAAHQWVVEPGWFRVMIGASSADLRLTARFQVEE